MKSRHKKFAGRACLTMLAGISSVAQGIEYTADLRAMTSVSYNDNVILESVGASDAWGSRSSIGGILNARASRWDIGISPKFALNRFKSDEDLNSDDVFVDSTLGYSFERARVGINIDYSDDFTRTSEATDVGLRRELTERHALTTSGNVRYYLSEYWTADFSGGYSETDYGEILGTSLTPYQYYFASAQTTYAYDAITQLYGTYSSTRFVPEATSGIESRTQNHSVSFGAIRELPANFSLNGSAGVQHSQSKTVQDVPVLVFTPFPAIIFVPDKTQSSSVSMVWNASVSKKFERSEALIEYSRQVNPSARGAQSVNDSVHFKYSFKIKPELRGFIDVEYDDRETQSGTAGALGQQQNAQQSLDRKHVIVHTVLRWNLTKNWAVNASYRFRFRDSARAVSNAHSNEILFALHYADNLISTNRYGVEYDDEL